MALGLLSVLTFLAVLGISLSTLYFLVEAPAARKQMRTRLASAQQLFYTPAGEPGLDLVAEEQLSENPLLNQILLKLPRVRQLMRFLAQADLEMKVDTFLLMCIACSLGGFGLGLLGNYPIVGILILGALCSLIPFGYVAYKRNRRFARFEELFPDAIDLLARAVRAGHAFTSGFELIAKEMPEPLAREFSTAYDQQNLGLPMREALDNLGRRVPLPDVQFFISALQIQRESGGNLAEILDKLSYVIRERFKLYRQVQIHTAEARVSLYILTAIPPATAFLLFFVNRDYMSTLIEEPLGHMMIVTAIVLQVIGFLVMKKISQLDV